MRGLFYYEWLILRKKITNLVFFIFLVSALVTALITITMKEPGSGKVFLSGEPPEDLISIITKELPVTSVQADGVIEVNFRFAEGQYTVEMRKEGSNAESLGAINKMKSILESYERGIVSERVSGLDVEPHYFDPIIVLDDEMETTVQNMMMQLIPVAFFVIPMLLTVTFNGGLFEERKQQSIYTLLLSGNDRGKFLITVLMFRVVSPAFIMYFFTSSIFGILLHDVALGFVILLPVLLQIITIYSMCLVFSLWVSSGTFMHLVSLLLPMSLPAGWILPEKTPIFYFPLIHGVLTTKQLLFSSWEGINHLLLTVPYYFACIAFVLLLGRYLLIHERVFTANAV